MDSFGCFVGKGKDFLVMGEVWKEDSGMISHFLA
jgi:hypothetical protein